MGLDNGCSCVKPLKYLKCLHTSESYNSPPRAETGLVSWCLSDSTVIVEGVTVVCKSEASDCEEAAFKKDFFVELSLEAQCCMQDVND